MNDAVVQAPPAPRKRASFDFLRGAALLPAIVALLVAGAFVNPHFLQPANLINIAGASSALALVVLAEALILIAGNFDLSLESTVGLAPAIGLLLVTPVMDRGWGQIVPVWAGLLAILVTGALVGLFNGLLIVRLRLNAFIVTLAMLIVMRGLLVGFTKGNTLFSVPAAFLYLGSETWLSIPVSVWVAAAIFIIAGIVLRYHRYGRALYAIGGNAEAARAAGIDVERITWSTFAIGGVLASIAGLILAGRLGAVSANQGNGMIFTVFAAAVIGGVSLDGGRGSALGALTGVLLLAVLENLLTFAQVQTFWIQAIYGAIILLALIAARVTGGKE
jgi:simple sugar transport system permease protein